MKVLVSLASLYGVMLTVTRKSTDDQVLAGYKKLIRKVHPDKAGKTEDAKRLQSTKNFWDTAKSEAKQAGRPNNDGPRSSETTQDGATELADPQKVHKVYRSRACAVMPSMQPIHLLKAWARLVKFPLRKKW